jgi:hypothetical protein
MLKKILLIVFLVSNFLLKAENNTYVDYFKKINQAELCIADSSYSEALSIYKGVFNSYPHRFYKDIYNATLCAIRISRYEEALKLSEDLVLYGYELKDFESAAFEDFRNNEAYWKSFLSKYGQLRKEYEKAVNLSLRDKWLSLYKIDQQAASHHGDVRLQDSVFYHLAISASNLIKEYGFPDWIAKKDTLNMKLVVMLRHYCGLENRIRASEEMQKDEFYVNMDGNDIRELVTQALNDGWLLPENYVNITTYWDNTNPYGTIAVEINFEEESIKPFLKALPKERDAINKRRELIGLPVINELSQEMINSTWYKDYPFRQIKKNWLNCDTCLTGKDYLVLEKNEALEVENSYIDNNKDFILQDMNAIRDIYYSGIQKYQKNAYPNFNKRKIS